MKNQILKINRRKIIFCAVLITFFGLVSVSNGQTNSINKPVKSSPVKNILSGAISDNFGAVIPGVELKLSKSKTQTFSAVSNDAGVYRFKNLPDGIYTLEVKPKAGFKSVKSINIRIRNGGESQYDIILKQTGKRSAVVKKN